MKEWYIEREEKRPEEIEYIVEDNDDGNEFNHHNKDGSLKGIEEFKLC